MMNIRVIQPPYPKRAEDTALSVSFMINELRQCDDSLDLILLPECCNAPSGCGDSCLLERLVVENTTKLLDAARETAIRCSAVVGINLYVYANGKDGKVRNATVLFDRKGQLAAQYDKQHLPASEYHNPVIDHSYLTETVAPECVEVDGVRYAFLTCYDIYYTEFIHRISMEKPDVILLCSLQRAERADILEMEAKNCAFVCNSYVVRSSYFMGETSTTGGCSMVVSPDGLVVKNFHQGLGSFDCAIEDIHYKYKRSNGFGQPEVTNDTFQTLYRTPWCYRVGGSGVRPGDKEAAYPRLCARRGFPQAAPENTVASIALAVAMGAEEVEIDVRATVEGIPVLSREATFADLSGQEKQIREASWNELRELDLGGRYAPHFSGIGYASLEEVLAVFPRRTIFRIHLPEYARGLIGSILELAQKYDCLEHIYFASAEETVLAEAAALAPKISRCYIADGADADAVLCKAQGLFCDKLSAEHMEVLLKAQRAGLRCSVQVEDLQTGKAQLQKGMDVLLTKQYLAMRKGLERN